MFVVCVLTDPEGHHQSVQVAAGSPGALRAGLGLPWSADRTEGTGRGEAKPQTDDGDGSERERCEYWSKFSVIEQFFVFTLRLFDRILIRISNTKMSKLCCNLKILCYHDSTP